MDVKLQSQPHRIRDPAIETRALVRIEERFVCLGVIIMCGVGIPISRMERKLFALLTALISNGTVFHEGYIMDAGANNGKSTVLLKKMFVNRTVLAVDPLKVNIRKILSIADESIQAVRGFLGASPSSLSYSSDAEKRVGQQIGKISMWENLMTKNLTQNVEVYTVDQLFREKKLAFAHWDLENSEHEMLQGAEATIRRDQPIFTVETHYQHYPESHGKVLETIRAFDYECLTIKESCGWSDCRNHLCAPREQMKQIKEIESRKKMNYGARQQTLHPLAALHA